MVDPLVTSIATAIVSGTAAAVGDGTRALLTKLAGLVRERLRRRPPDNGVLEVAISDPDDQGAVRRLAETLDQHMRDDPAFAKQLRAVWSEITATEARHRDDVSNTIGGPVHGSVVQARDVSGGITFQQPPRRP
jgi:hypothetical protein